MSVDNEYFACYAFIEKIRIQGLEKLERGVTMGKVVCPVCGYESPMGTETCPMCEIELNEAEFIPDENDATAKSWSVVLLDANNQKLAVIKKIRELTSLGLKEAKDLVDNPPQVVISGISETEALQYEQEFIDLGANAITTVGDAVRSVPQSATTPTKSVASSDEKREQQHRIAEKSAEIDKKQPSGCLLFFFSFLGVVAFFTYIGADASSGGVTALILILTVIVFIVVLAINSNQKQSQLDNLREDIVKEQEKKRGTMEQVFEQAAAKGFSASTKVTDPQNRFCIATDNQAKKFLVKSSLAAEYRIYKFADLVDYELSQDGVSTIASRAGDALVGGVLFGATGAVIGAAQSKDIQEYCSSLYIALTLNTTSGFRVQIPFVSGKISKTSSEYAFAVERAKEMIALLQLIKNSNETEQRENRATARKKEPGIDTAAMEAIKQYKELLDLGIISQEEFDLKRKELLNI